MDQFDRMDETFIALLRDYVNNLCGPVRGQLLFESIAVGMSIIISQRARAGQILTAVEAFEIWVQEHVRLAQLATFSPVFNWNN